MGQYNEASPYLRNRFQRHASDPMTKLLLAAPVALSICLSLGLVLSA